MDTYKKSLDRVDERLVAVSLSDQNTLEYNCDRCTRLIQQSLPVIQQFQKKLKSRNIESELDVGKDRFVFSLFYIDGSRQRLTFKPFVSSDKTTLFEFENCYITEECSECHSMERVNLSSAELESVLWERLENLILTAINNSRNHRGLKWCYITDD